MELLTSFLYQLVFTIGIIVVFGLIIAFSRRSIVRLGRAGYRAIIITGVVGTPVHELGHAIACFVFGHNELCVLFLLIFHPILQEFHRQQES